MARNVSGCVCVRFSSLFIYLAKVRSLTGINAQQRRSRPHALNVMFDLAETRLLPTLWASPQPRHLPSLSGFALSPSRRPYVGFGIDPSVIG